MKESWYVGSCKSSDVEEKLALLGNEDGLFLVRQMPGKDKTQLAFLVGGEMRSLYIRDVNKKYSLDGTEASFDTVEQLVAHYTYTPLPLPDVTLVLKTSVVGHF